MDHIDVESEGLRYVSTDRPGYTRRRAGKGWAYYDTTGDLIRNDRIRDRINALAIPPAWTDVWICPSPNGHIQATGRDDKGRKQYRYHSRWREVRDRAKFEKTIEFAEALPKIRRRVRRDLNRDGLPKEKVVAVVVNLLDRTMGRVGNEEYARDNDSYGLTTLRDRHADVNGTSFTLRYDGKGGKEHRVELHDARLARIVKRCRDVPGQVLFQYLDGKGGCPISSTDVNDYLRAVAGDDFTAKDFRTWAGTVVATQALLDEGVQDSETEARRAAARAVEHAAGRLGNTPTVCRNCYIHPWVLDGAQDGSLHTARDAFDPDAEAVPELRRDEAFVLSFLRSVSRRAKRSTAA